MVLGHSTPMIELPMASSQHRLEIRPPAPAPAMVVGMIAVMLSGSPLLASDHADPMDLTRLKPLEPVITDLFVFPVDAAGKPAFPFDRTDGIRLHNPDVKRRSELAPEQRAQIKALVVILCVRRALTQTGSLNLKPYAYRVHMDTRSKVAFDDTPADLDDEDAAEGMGYAPVGGTRRQVTGQELARRRYGGTIEHPESIHDDVLPRDYA